MQSGRWPYRLVVLPLIAVIGLYFLSMTSQPPESIGANNGRLAECPDSPNCVATQSGKDSQRMDAIEYSGTPADILAEIKQAISNKFTRVKLVSEKDNYLHYEFTSLIFRFVDDVEFLVDDTEKKVHFRSASRVGYSDLGANRKRMQTIIDEL